MNENRFIYETSDPDVWVEVCPGAREVYICHPADKTLSPEYEDELAQEAFDSYISQMYVRRPGDFVCGTFDDLGGTSPEITGLLRKEEK